MFEIKSKHIQLFKDVMQQYDQERFPEIMEENEALKKRVAELEEGFEWIWGRGNDYY